MKNINVRYLIPVVLAVGGAVSIQTVSATMFNDLTTGGTVTVNGGVFSSDNFHTAGTGYISPFYRLQQSGNDTYEAGYNTSLGTPLNDDNAWNYDLPTSSLVPTLYNGINYYDFRLDANEPKSGSSQITLNQVQIFGKNSPALATGVTMDSTTGRAVDPGGALGTLLWDMNPGDPTGDAILLDYAYSSGGSGTGDMQLLVPVSALSGYDYIVLYSQFGKDPIAGGTPSNAGFEEWIAITGTPIPEASTVIAGLLLLLPLGASTLRVLRKKQLV